MGIGGVIIKRKLPFAVLLILGLFLASIAGASAADVDTAQSQAVNNSTVQENAGIHTNNTYNENESVATQNSTEENITEGTSTATSNASTNQTTVKTEPVAQDTANTSADQNATTFTVTSTNSTSKNSTDTETNTQNAASAAVNSSQNSTSTKTNTGNNTTSTQTQSTGYDTIKNNGSYQKAAAGETKVISKSFTVKQINNAAARVKAYVETNHRLPNYVAIGTIQVQMSDFLKLLVANLLQLNNGKTSSITLKSINSAAKPSENVKSGTITKAGYLDLAKRVNAFINANGILPNYATSSLGKLNYKSLIYMFSKVLAFYNTNSRLPSYVTVKPWSKVGTSDTSTSDSSTPVPASLQQYLKATKNCEVTNSQIQALAKSITSGKSSTYAKASAIFNWVRDNIGYKFYYNSVKGAVGTLTSKSANCCDTSNLLVALERAAGIPARYEHVYAKFSSGTWYGHVIAQVWVNGKWYYADASSSRNTFGVINNWNTTTATVYGTYASLSF
ncbi:pseudomurein-binding repeat-containing protein [Methanobacterium sp.]|uniref:transglutaminase domain-containing protein n=1 Tax=Methanobacterium sp. TaxID=2164 RepID=UPI0031595E28